MSTAPRSRLAAALLSLAAPGVGQIYLGRTGRGLAWMGAVLVVPLLPALFVSEVGKGTLLAIFVAGVVVGVGCAIDAVRFCPAEGVVPVGRVVGFGLALYVLAPIFVALGLRILVLEAFKIPAGSMMPTLVVGDHVFADKIVYRKRAPRRGEVMIFKYPEHPTQDFVKRVIGVGGDRIEVASGHPRINGWEVPSCAAGTWSYDDALGGGEKHSGELFVEYLDGAAYLVFLQRASFVTEYQGPYVVAKGGTFVMGDNRNNSHDSRMWFGGSGGTVPPENVRGRPRWIWLSSEPGRTWLDIAAAEPAVPAGAQKSAIDACLASRPPREKTVPPEPK